MRGEISLPVCECNETHRDLIELGIAAMPSEDKITELADFFKLFSDETRLGILFALDGAELCVCDIADILKMTKSAVSHQLKALRQMQLIKFRKSGKNVYYSLADSHVVDIIEKALEHINE